LLITESSKQVIGLLLVDNEKCQHSGGPGKARLKVLPGMRHHLSNQGSTPASLSLCAITSTAGLSALLWERKMSKALTAVLRFDDLGVGSQSRDKTKQKHQRAHCHFPDLNQLVIEKQSDFARRGQNRNGTITVSKWRPLL
jgi:hypothetical protein